MRTSLRGESVLDERSEKGGQGGTFGSIRRFESPFMNDLGGGDRRCPGLDKPFSG